MKAFVDTEARVLGYKLGKGKNADKMGSLSCEMADGHRFELGGGFTDAQRGTGYRRRWPVGTVVTFKYQNLTAKGAPRFPIYLRVRADKTWGNVVADHKKDLTDAAAAKAHGGKLARVPSFMQRVPA